MGQNVASKNEMIKKIDDRLKQIAIEMHNMTEEIETINAPFHSYEYKDQDCELNLKQLNKYDI